MKTFIVVLVTVAIFIASSIYFNHKWGAHHSNNISNNIEKPKSSSEISSRKDWVMVENFGAKGDGKTDDTEALQSAINSLGKKGGTVILRPSKTYRVTSTLTAHTNITMISYGSKPAEILMDNNSEENAVLSFSGAEKYTTTLSDKITYSDSNIVSLKDSSQIKTGDLILIESDTPWYYDPRTATQNLHKGELHKVKGVSGSKIMLDEGLWDTYNKQTEDITVKVINPIKVTVKNITIDRPMSKNRTLGIKLKYTANSIIQKVNVKNSSDIGIYLVSSYRTLVESSRISGANSSMTGYGIQSFGSTYSDIRGNKITNSRRGVDISGVYPDNHAIVEFNTVYGGGVNEDGLHYLSQDTQYGLGTHSTANFTVFKGNILGNLTYGINTRSKNVTIKLNQFNGYFRESCIVLVYGKNVNITNNKVVANKSEVKQDKIIKNGSANSFLDIKRSFQLDQGFVYVNSNEIYAERNQFIKFVDTFGDKRTKVNKLIVKDNNISYILLNRNQPFYLINSEFKVEAENSEVLNNKIEPINKERSFIYYRNFTIRK